ncbi:hypothetical protein MY10362_009907 [Beauveria mimosiformis]
MARLPRTRSTGGADAQRSRQATVCNKAATPFLQKTPYLNIEKKPILQLQDSEEQRYNGQADQ